MQAVGRHDAFASWRYPYFPSSVLVFRDAARWLVWLADCHRRTWVSNLPLTHLLVHLLAVSLAIVVYTSSRGCS